MDGLLGTWIHRRWICAIGDRYLNVLPRRGPLATTSSVEPVSVEPSKRKTGLPMLA